MNKKELIQKLNEFPDDMEVKAHMVMLSIGQYSDREVRVYKAFYNLFDAIDFEREIINKINEIKLDDGNRRDKYTQILGVPPCYLPKHFPSYMKLSFYTVCDVPLN